MTALLGIIAWLTLFLLCARCSGAVEEDIPITFVISSGIANIERRNANRLTWLTWLKEIPGLSYKFYVEKPLDSVEEAAINYEQSLFNDLVISNVTRPRLNDFKQCSARRWEYVKHSYEVYGENVHYYITTDDDCFFCLHHLVHDAKYWPKSRRFEMAHYWLGSPDVLFVYGSPVLRDALNLVAQSTPELAEKYVNEPIHDLIGANRIKDVERINDLRFMYGAQGQKNNRWNDWANGWVGTHIASGPEKFTFCEIALSGHQMYPIVMMDVWAFVSKNTRTPNYTVPALSRDIRFLDKSVDERPRTGRRT